MPSKVSSFDDTALSSKRLCRALCIEMLVILPNERRYIYEGAMLQSGVWWSSIGFGIEQAVGKDSSSKPHQSLLYSFANYDIYIEDGMHLGECNIGGSSNNNRCLTNALELL